MKRLCFVPSNPRRLASKPRISNASLRHRSLSPAPLAKFPSLSIERRSRTPPLQFFDYEGTYVIKIMHVLHYCGKALDNIYTKSFF